MNLNDLRDQRGKLAAEMRSMVETAAKDNRELTSEENEKFDRLNTDQEKLRSTIEKAEKVDSIDSELSQVRTIGAGRESVQTRIVKPEDQDLNAWRSFLRVGPGDMPASEVATLRALSVGTASAGGYSAPAKPTAEFVKLLRDLTSVRQAPVRVFTTDSGNDIPFPTVDDTGTSAAVNVEGVATGDTTDPTFGQITLKAYGYDSNVVRISKRLLQDTVLPIEQLVNEFLAERIAAKINTAYTTGNGTTAPQGITVGAGASSVTLPATTLGATATAIYQNVQSIIHSVAPQYRKRPSFGLMFSDSTLLEYKKQVDSTGRPLWSAGMAVGEPDRLCGVPYYINPDMASIGASAKSIVVGDFSQFIVRDVLSVEFIRMDELYAAYLQVGFLCWFRTDSKVMNSSAIKYVAHASS